METYIPARSPLLAYAPCRDCGGNEGGWVGVNGTGGGVTGGVGRLSIGFNLTGTGITYHFSQAPPANWTVRLLVNSSVPPPSANLTRTSLTNLPLGPHRFTLDLFPPPTDPFSPLPPNDTASANTTFAGATGYLGTMLTAATRNVTIDDAAWRNEDVILSPGWNMLEGGPGGVSNWINTAQMDVERGRAGESFNSSLSWTEQRGANTTIRFGGEAVWVYGAAGGAAGAYEVIVDNRTVGVFNGSGGTREYGQILYHTAALTRGNHTLTLRNREEGKRLSFDRLVAMSGIVIAAPRPTASDPASTLYPSAPAASTGSGRLSIGALAGIAIAAIVVVLCLIAGILFCLWKRDPKRRSQAGGKSPQGVEKGRTHDETVNTFFKWPRSGTPPFFRLPDPSQPGAAGAIARVFQRGSGATAANTSAHSKKSFIPGSDSPRSGHTGFPYPSTEDKYTSFLKFSKSPRRSKDRPPISSPIPFAESPRPDHLERQDSLDGLSPALAAAISGRTTSPLAQLRNGDMSGVEEKSYLPKMTALGSMFSGSGRAQGDGGDGEGKKRFSMDTIGRIFGTYANQRDTMDTSAAEGMVGVAVGSKEDRERWDERVRQIGKPMAL